MNEEKLRQLFAESLKIPVERVDDSLAYTSIAEWDSIGHMVLIAAIDEAFDVMLETDDVIDLSSFAKAKQILSKYGVAF